MPRVGSLPAQRKTWQRVPTAAKMSQKNRMAHSSVKLPTELPSHMIHRFADGYMARTFCSLGMYSPSTISMQSAAIPWFTRLERASCKNDADTSMPTNRHLCPQIGVSGRDLILITFKLRELKGFVEGLDSGQDDPGLASGAATEFHDRGILRNLRGYVAGVLFQPGLLHA